MKTLVRSFAFSLVLLLAPSARAVSLYALTSESPSRLLIVDGDVPAKVLSVRPIMGLDAGDTLVGIDVRPATGQLYALGSGAHLYTIDPNTGVATNSSISRPIPPTSPRLFTRV